MRVLSNLLVTGFLLALAGAPYAAERESAASIPGTWLRADATGKTYEIATFFNDGTACVLVYADDEIPEPVLDRATWRVEERELLVTVTSSSNSDIRPTGYTLGEFVDSVDAGALTTTNVPYKFVRERLASWPREEACDLDKALAKGRAHPVATPGRRRVIELQPGTHVSPAVVTRTPLSYPPSAIANEWTGTADVSVVLGAAGEPRVVSLYRSSGYSLLDDAAIATVRQWKFKAGQIGNRAVITSFRVRVHFELE